MENNFEINLSNFVGVIVQKTLEFSGVEKTDEELQTFCFSLFKDEDLINAMTKIIKLD